MRKYLIATCLLANISICIGQTTVTIERTEIFCKAWGFLKYYHPSIASGKFDWDSVFLNNIQKVIQAKTYTEFNDILNTIINDAGKVELVKQAKNPDSLFTLNKTNIDWIINSTILNNQIKDKLKFIYENKNESANKYIKIEYDTPDFSSENKYENIRFPDTQYRLLFLTRFWNIINYFAPYKYLTGNWDDVLKKFIPAIINSNDTLAYYIR